MGGHGIDNLFKSGDVGAGDIVPSMPYLAAAASMLWYMLTIIFLSFESTSSNDGEPAAVLRHLKSADRDTAGVGGLSGV